MNEIRPQYSALLAAAINTRQRPAIEREVILRIDYSERAINF